MCKCRKNGSDRLRKGQLRRRYPCSVPQLIQRITGKAFRISLGPDWQIDSGIFKRPIMTSTQILIHMWGLGQGFRRCFSEGLSRGLVSSAAQAYTPFLKRLTRSINNKEKV